MSKTQQIVEERGTNYGHPADQFELATTLYETWRARRLAGDTKKLPDKLEKALHHAVYMILTKISRTATNPLHMDNWDDKSGYAKCFKMCVEREGVITAEPATQDEVAAAVIQGGAH